MLRDHVQAHAQQIVQRALEQLAPIPIRGEYVERYRLQEVKDSLMLASRILAIDECPCSAPDLFRDLLL